MYGTFCTIHDNPLAVIPREEKETAAIVVLRLSGQTTRGRRHLASEAGWGSQRLSPIRRGLSLREIAS